MLGPHIDARRGYDSVVFDAIFVRTRPSSSVSHKQNKRHQHDQNTVANVAHTTIFGHEK